MIALTSPLVVLLLTALAGGSVLGVAGAAASLRRLGARRAARRQENVARWQADPTSMGMATAAAFREEGARLEGRLGQARTRAGHAKETLAAFADSLSAKPAWKWVILAMVLPVSLVIVYVHAMGDINSFFVQHRPSFLAVVLGLGLSLSLLLLPFFIRLHLDEVTGFGRAAWTAGLVAGVVLLIGVSAMVAGGRGEAAFADEIQKAETLHGYYRGRGQEAEAAAEEAKLDELRRERDVVVAQDQLFAAGLGAAEAVFGWYDVLGLAAVVLLAKRANLRRHEGSVARWTTRLERHDRRLQLAVVRGAAAAGVLDRLELAGGESQAGRGPLDLGWAQESAPDDVPEPPDPPSPGPEGQPPSSPPPSSATTPHDDNL